MIFAIISCGVICEMFLKFFFPQPAPMRWFKSDPIYGYVNENNAIQDYPFLDTDYIMKVRINSIGLRGDDYNMDKLYNKKILSLGDSYTFGFGIDNDQTFNMLLQQQLDNLFGYNSHAVFNAGVAGWGTSQELLYGINNMIYFSPDYIILTICPNDLDDDKLFNKGLHDNDKGIFSFPGKEWLKNNTHLWVFLRHKLKPFIVDLLYTNHTKDSELIEMVDKDWSNTLIQIKEFYKSFKSYNPNGKLLLQITEPCDNYFNNVFKQLDNGEDLIFIDLSDKACSIPEYKRELSFDGHWSPEMHSLSADYILQCIIKNQ